MDYSEILRTLQKASLFDLYRLRVGLDGLMDQPERILPIKRRLRPGMEIAYFSPRENKQVDAVVEEVRRTCLYVCGTRWMANSGVSAFMRSTWRG